MTQSHLPRALFTLLFILVAVTFLVGILHAFVPARAVVVLDTPAQNTNLPTSTSTADFPSPGPPLTPPPASLLPPATGAATLIPTPPLTSAATSLMPPATPSATLIPTPASTFTDTPQAAAAESSGQVPEPIYISDMTGVTALGILMVVVVLVGITWGGRNFRKKK